MEKNTNKSPKSPMGSKLVSNLSGLQQLRMQKQNESKPSENKTEGEKGDKDKTEPVIPEKPDNGAEVTPAQNSDKPEEVLVKTDNSQEKTNQEPVFEVKPQVQGKHEEQPEKTNRVSSVVKYEDYFAKKDLKSERMESLKITGSQLQKLKLMSVIHDISITNLSYNVFDLFFSTYEKEFEKAKKKL